MTDDARRRAERCFALARSTTFEGERSNAIERGTKIATDAGLSLDLFDIPGRKKAPPASRYGEDLFTRPRSPLFTHGGYSKDELNDVIERFREAMEASTNRAYFEEIFGRERAKRETAKEQTDDQRERALWDRAASFLSARGVKVYPLTSDWRLWSFEGEEIPANKMVFRASLAGFQQ